MHTSTRTLFWRRQDQLASKSTHLLTKKISPGIKWSAHVYILLQLKLGSIKGNWHLKSVPDSWCDWLFFTQTYKDRAAITLVRLGVWGYFWHLQHYLEFKMHLISHFSRLKIGMRLLVLCLSTAEKMYHTKIVNFEILNDDQKGGGGQTATTWQTNTTAISWKCNNSYTYCIALVHGM